MTTRRGFLGTMLAAAMAPAVVKASSLMSVWVPPAPKVWTPFDDIDFEEGWFTPSVLGAGGFAAASGHYTRIGRTVQIRATVNLSGPARDLQIIGLPGASTHVKNGETFVSGMLHAKNDAELDAALPRFLARRRITS